MEGILNALCTRASEERHKIPCRLDPAPFQSGSFHTIHTIHFDDGVEWIARLSTKSMRNGYIPINEDMDRFRSEVATMQWLKRSTIVKIPEIYAWNAPIGDQPTTHNWGPPNLQSVAWMLMEKLPGVPLTYDLWDTLEDRARHKILAQVADMFLELARYSFDKLGSLQGGVRPSNSVEIEPRIYRYSFSPASVSSTDKLSLTSVYRDDISQVSNREIKDTITSLHQYLNTEASKDESRPYLLAHPDLNPTNVILNPSTLDISGLIDWDCAHTVSVSEFSIHPWFIQDRYYVNFSVEELARNCKDRDYFSTYIQQEQMNRGPGTQTQLMEDMSNVRGAFLLSQYLHDTVCTNGEAREKMHEKLGSKVKSYMKRDE